MRTRRIHYIFTLIVQKAKLWKSDEKLSEDYRNDPTFSDIYRVLIKFEDITVSLITLE